MKKVLLFAVVLGAVTLTSCKKDYTCTCTTSGNGVNSSASTTINATKSDAEDACTASTSSAFGFTTTCELD